MACMNESRSWARPAQSKRSCSTQLGVLGNQPGSGAPHDSFHELGAHFGGWVPYEVFIAEVLEIRGSIAVQP